uniref:ATP synthase subunit gamma, mitochondrial n=1 Tax=Myotis lucifugus TaxID=59463 RepID=G1PXY1_MYOLU
MKSIIIILKISKSMKMAAAAKYARAERKLQSARMCGTGSSALYEQACDKVPANKNFTHLLIGMSSDRVLCSATHFLLAKQMKREVAMLTAAGKVKMVGIGDKIRGILHKTHSDQFLITFKEVGRKPPTFGDVSVIALELLNSGYELDEGSIIFNRFRSVISYKTKKHLFSSLNTIVSAECTSTYDDIDADMLENYQEYLANITSYSLKDYTTSEQNASMTAMDNASKNASKVIDKLTLTFNHIGQAVSTKELIEIISSAAALD